MALTNSLQSQINAIAKQYGIPPNLFTGLIKQESGFSNASHSSAGAIGYTQLMPGTARGLGVNPYDPKQNLIGGAKYLAAQLKAFGGDYSKALAAYNAGPGAVRKYGGIPPYAETQNYVKQVLKYAQAYGSGGIPTGSDMAPRIDTAPPQIDLPYYEKARSPTLSRLSNTTRLGAFGTSVRNPNLTIKKFDVSVSAPQSSALSVDFSGGGTSGGAVGIAKQYIGVPYLWGGTSKKGFDCSGLTQSVYRSMGKSIPRVAEAQFRASKRISQAQARPGDLVFFRHADGVVGHVGIYIGNGQMIDAPHTGAKVRVDSLSGRNIAGFGRF